MSLFAKQGFHSAWFCVVWFTIMRVKGDQLDMNITEYDDYDNNTDTDNYNYTDNFTDTDYGDYTRDVVKGSPRIVGGVDAEIKEFPFLISLQYKRRHYCGGSLVTFRWILTASHCLANREWRKSMSVLAGATNVTRRSAGSQRRTVVLVIMHRYYRPEGNWNDIGMVEVERDFDHSHLVSLVRLPRQKNFSLDPYEGETGTCAGWGALHYEGRPSPILQKVDLQVISYSSCQSAYKKLHIPTHMFFCAREEGKDACQGDSGGPFIYNGVQIGVVSYGIKCADKWPGVYTRVDRYLGWIQSHAYGHTRDHRHKPNCICLLLWAWMLSLS